MSSVFTCMSLSIMTLTVMIWALSSADIVEGLGLLLKSLWKACIAFAVTSFEESEAGVKNGNQIKMTEMYELNCSPTTWLRVMTRRRVSQQDLTEFRGNADSSSFSRPSTWRVVVSSLLPWVEYKDNIFIIIIIQKKWYIDIFNSIGMVRHLVTCGKITFMAQSFHSLFLFFHINI